MVPIAALPASAARTAPVGVPRSAATVEPAQHRRQPVGEVFRRPVQQKGRRPEPPGAAAPRHEQGFRSNNGVGAMDISVILSRRLA